MNAELWFKKFYQRYYKDSSIQKLERKKSLTDRQWTKGMEYFLRTMASSEGYSVTPESGVVGNGRIDHKWIKGSRAIVIEHENWWKGVSREIEKLCDHAASLKVLITYVPDRNFVADCHLIAKDYVAKEIDKHPGEFKGEFLLVVCGENYADWTAFQFPLRVQPDPIRI
jgi:hypothetical protein